MKRLKTFFGYLDYLGLIGFVVVFGLLLWPQTALWGGVWLAVAAMLLVQLIVRGVWGRGFAINPPLGNVLTDCGLFIFSILSYRELEPAQQYLQPLFVAGMVMTGLDLAMFLIDRIAKK